MGFREENDNIVSRLRVLEKTKVDSEEMLKKINDNILKLIELQKDLLINIKDKKFNYEYIKDEMRPISTTNKGEESVEFMPSIDDTIEVKTRTKRTIQKQETNTELPDFMKHEDK